MYWAQKIDWCCIWNRSLITSFVYASGIIPGPSNSTGIKFLYLFITNHNTSEWEFLFPWHYYINISIYLILYYLCLYLYIDLYYLYVLNVKINIWFDLIWMNLFFVRESYNQSGSSGWGDGEFGGWVLIKEIKFKVFLCYLKCMY